ncbi:MAG: hypothetical protein Q9162_001140 [Coniocarpon cinnabarinum]
MSAPAVQAYELYRTSSSSPSDKIYSLGVALTDTLDDLISSNQIEPQLAMKILGNFDKAFAEIIADKVKSRLSFKGHLDTYRFCDDVWTFMVKDVSFKLDSQSTLRSDKVKIVSCTNKKAEGT